MIVNLESEDYRLRRMILCAALTFGLLLASCNKSDIARPPEPTSEAAAPQIEITEPATAMVTTITPQFGARISEKKKENADTVGWLKVPGTSIDSVIVKNPEEDNGFYIMHAFDQTPNKNGTYCADRRCDFASGLRSDIPRNITLYGHNFTENPDGELFDQLKKYKDPNFAREHPYIFFSTATEDMAWEVFAIFDATIDLPYIIPDLSWETFRKVMDVVYSASIYDYGITVTENDKILTLSCCTYDVPGKGALPLDVPNDYRFVIMARLVGPYESIRETATFTINNNPLAPDDMPMIYHEGQDVLIYDGLLCMVGSEWPDVMAMDLNNATLIGEIKRGGVTVDLRDWDAVKLKAGTKILRHNEQPHILIAQVDGQNIPYIIMHE